MKSLSNPCIPVIQAVMQHHEKQVIASTNLALSHRMVLSTCIWTQIGHEFGHKTGDFVIITSSKGIGLSHLNTYKSMSCDQFYWFRKLGNLTRDLDRQPKSYPNFIQTTHFQQDPCQIKRLTTG